MNPIFDGLIIIHPEFGIPRNSSYRANLKRYIAECHETGKPVFLVDSDEYPIRDGEMKKLFDDTFGIPSFEEFTGMQKRQREIDYISGIIGREPSKSILGFGGTDASCCVYAHAIGWCREVLTRFEPKLIGVPEKINPISQGVILGDIV
jgi:hypothetical protein